MKKHEIFKTNPNLKEVHVTSDGQSFYNENDAKLHAKSLEDKQVELVVNPDHIVAVDEVIEDTETDESTTEAATEETVSTEAEAVGTEVETKKITPKK